MGKKGKKSAGHEVPRGENAGIPKPRDLEQPEKTEKAAASPASNGTKTFKLMALCDSLFF